MIVSKSSAESFLNKRLKGLGGGKRSYYVLSEDGTRNLGGPYTKDQAKKRLGQVEYFKHENPLRKSLYIYPNEASVKVAKRALERRKTIPRSRRGGLDALQAKEQGIGSGVMRARDIASGKRINAYQVKAFFDRHRHNYVKARADRKKWEDSKAWQAWDLWGGEPLRKQVERAVAKDKKMRANPSVNRPYTVFLAQNRPRSIHLYEFKSNSLISPSSSASEYSWMLNQSAVDDGYSTHIFTSKSDLDSFIKRNKNKSVVKKNPRIQNPRNSIVKDALASEAVRYDAFKDFAEAYWNACSRGLYWISVDEKRFHIGDDERRIIDSGKFFVSCSPDLAIKRSEKKYVAEVDVTRLPASYISIKRGTDGAEVKITGSADNVRVRRVMDADKARRAFKWQLSVLPSSREELRLVWEKAWDKRRKAVELRKIKEEKQLERELRRAERRKKSDRELAARKSKKAKAKAKAEKERRVKRGELEARKKKMTSKSKAKAAGPKAKRSPSVRVRPDKAREMGLSSNPGRKTRRVKCYVNIPGGGQ